MSRRKNKHRSTASAPAASFLLDTRKNLPAEQRTLIANARNDITIPFYSGVLQHADETLIQQGNGKGLAIYDEIERDTHAYAMLQKRKKTLTARAWEVQPGGDRPIDKDAALLVEAVFKALPFDRMCEDLLDATLKGYAVSETVWTREGDYILPRTVLAHDQRRFVFDQAWKPRLLTWTDAREGIPLPDRKFLIHRYGVKGNNPYGLGLGTRLFWAVLFKREGVTFWAHFLEKFAGPTVVGKTPIGSMPDEQNRLLNSLSQVRTSSAVIVPIGTDLEFLEAARSGSVSYEQWLAYWDRQISICVTGETLTTQVGESGGNRALGEVHQEMLEMLVDSDADLLSETLRDQLVQWIVDYNLPGGALPTIWRPRPKNEDALATTRQTKAVAAEAVSKAIRTIVAASAEFEDDEIARDYILSFEITDQLSDRTIEALLAARHSFAQADQAEADAFAVDDRASFSTGPKKKA